MQVIAFFPKGSSEKDIETVEETARAAFFTRHEEKALFKFDPAMGKHGDAIVIFVTGAITDAVFRFLHDLGLQLSRKLGERYDICIRTCTEFDMNVNVEYLRPEVA